MKKTPLLLLFMCSISLVSFSQIDARMFRFPDVSDTHITFSYAGDIWIVAKEGGTATHLSSPTGEEIMPKFSPDGLTIAFSGNYQGNTDVYAMPITGGIPTRLTYHGGGDRVVDWHPNGQQVLFASGRESGKNRWNQFYLTGIESGLPVKLPLEHAEYGSYSEDGKMMAFTDKSRLSRSWKRYRGGTAPDIWLMNLETKEAEKIARNIANDELPMIKGDEIFFLSDRGEHMRANLWVYNTTNGNTEQLTNYSDYDVHFPSMGDSEIVYEAGGKLYLYNMNSKTSNEVAINLVSDQRSLLSKTVNVGSRLSSVYPSHDAKRLVVEARGDIFSVPVEHGFTENLTQTSGVAERYPTLSPDGKYLAFWSDKSGEYQLVVRDRVKNTEKTVTEFTEGYRYEVMWSPDSKKLVFIEQDLEIKLLYLDNQQVVVVDSLHSGFHSTTENFSVNWGPKSEWFTWAADSKTKNSVIAVYNVKGKSKHILTSGFYTDYSPAFSKDGKYIYFLTDRNFSPQYSNFQGSWAYTNGTKIACIPLTEDVASPLAFRNDEISVKQTKKKEEKEEKKEEKKDEKEKKKGTEITLKGAEQRIVVLPIKGGNYHSLSTVKGKILFLNSTNNRKDLKYWDVKAREEKTIISDISNYALTPDGSKVLAMKGNRIAFISPSPGQKLTKTISTKEMTMTVDPKAEWAQIFREVWRLERDYFYDKQMHGLDWQKVYERYKPLLDQCVTRWDVNFVIGELIGELNASHAYKRGGDSEYASYVSVGYLGVNFGFNEGYFQIESIMKGSDWDAENRSPLSEPGVDVKEGDYLLAINGVDLDSSKSPYASFQKLRGKTIELTVNDQPNKKGARKVVVKTMSNEYRLRHLSWIESKRKRVEEATNGEVGYIYVPNTGVDGQSELFRQFMGQWTKPALIIDERWNSGGQIPDRFIELLNRKPFSYLAGRTGKDRQVPYVAHFGPKVMMINGWAGSGGDAFPDYFRKANLGELIGTRTWGGLIGISGAPTLIDGGSVTVPTFRLYDPNGEWFKEGHGVDPDIEVDEDAGQLAKGVDPQLEKTIEVILQKLETERFIRTPHEGYEKR